MSMIQKLEKISAEMFQQMLKTYQMKDVIVHKRAKAINVLQYCSLYPSRGIGFKIKRKTWPVGTHFLLKDPHYKSNRFGHFTGIKYQSNRPVDQYPKRLQGLNKRGVWDFDLGDFDQFTTDNGVTYTRADYQAYFNLRLSKQKTSSQLQQTIQEGQQADQQVQQGEQQTAQGESSQNSK